MKRLLALSSVFLTLLAGTPAFAGTPLNKVEALVQGPGFIEVVSPYQKTLECLAATQTPAERAVAYGVLAFPDKTARIGYSQENAAGGFMTQGEEDMIITSLRQTGVQVVDISPQYRGFFDWSAVRSGAHNVGLFLPDIVITGSINSLDFLPGGGLQVNGLIKAGGQQNRINLAFDARAVTMPFIDRPGEPPKPGPWYNPDKQASHVISTFAFSKQIVQYGFNAGAAGFVGGGDLRTFFQLDWGENKREALQYAGHMAADVIAFRIVRDVTGITSCDDEFVHALPATSLIANQPPVPGPQAEQSTRPSIAPVPEAQAMAQVAPTPHDMRGPVSATPDIQSLVDTTTSSPASTPESQAITTKP